MSITIKAPEIEQRIRQLAAKQGVPADQYVLELVKSHLPEIPWDERVHDQAAVQSSADKEAIAKQRIAALERWAQQHPANAPLIQDEALRRENLYEDRGL